MRQNNATATQSTAGVAGAAQIALRVQQQLANVRQVEYLAIAVSAAILLATALHLTARFRRMQKHRGISSRARLSCSIRGLMLRECPGFISLGQAVVFLVYLAVNVVLLCTNLDASSALNWGKRFGWLAAGNLCLVVFLALKNTPLAFLTAYSYERLNPLHQLAGYATIVMSCMHAVCQLIGFYQLHESSMFVESANIYGEVALGAFIILGGTAVLLRQKHYEAFYIIHICMFLLILVTVALHRPLSGQQLYYVMIFAAAIWLADRSVRALRLLWNFHGNKATISNLSDGAVRLSLHRPLWRAVPGNHIFLWIPGLRAIEAHPFTIVSTEPLAFVIKAHDGFTRDLKSRAITHSGQMLRASVDGPYGTLPDFNAFHSVALLAGGSGITFALGVASTLLRSRNSCSDATSGSIHLLWAVSETSILSWFAEELRTLDASPLINLSIHVTRPAMTKEPVPNSPMTAGSGKSPDARSTEKDLEDNRSLEAYQIVDSMRHKLGRPDIKAWVDATVAMTPDNERLMVAACGPQSLMREARAVVARAIPKAGPSVHFHAEQYGW